MISDNYLVIASPKALQQVYVDNNKYHTKPWVERARFGKFAGNSIVFAKTEDQTYKSRRAALSSGFFKSKANYMIQVVKKNTLTQLNDFKDKNEIDIEKFTEEL